MFFFVFWFKDIAVLNQDFKALIYSGAGQVFVTGFIYMNLIFLIMCLQSYAIYNLVQLGLYYNYQQKQRLQF